MQSSKLFRSAQGESEFLAAYDAAMRLWPVPFQRRNLHTRFGRTHVITCGDESAPPLVLLHCALMTSAVWGPAIGELAARFRVHAVDVIGDMGRTVPADPPGTHAQFAGWLAEVCDGLGIERAEVGGVPAAGAAQATAIVADPAQSRREHQVQAVGHDAVTMGLKILLGDPLFGKQPSRIEPVELELGRPDGEFHRMQELGIWALQFGRRDGRVVLVLLVVATIRLIASSGHISALFGSFRRILRSYR